MNWIFERKLKKLGQEADPDPRFVRLLEKRLQSAAGLPMRNVSVWKWAVGCMSSASLVFSGAGAFAYTSDSVIPGHPLYGLRSSVERLEVALAAQPSSRVRISLKHLERRLHEHQLLKKQQGSVSKTNVTAFINQLNRLVEESDALSDAERNEVNEKAVTLKSTEESIATDSNGILEPEVKEKIENLKEKIRASSRKYDNVKSGN